MLFCFLLGLLLFNWFDLICIPKILVERLMIDHIGEYGDEVDCFIPYLIG